MWTGFFQDDTQTTEQKNAITFFQYFYINTIYIYILNKYQISIYFDIHLNFPQYFRIRFGKYHNNIHLNFPNAFEIFENHRA